MKNADDENILKGVSTLDLMKSNIKAILLPVILVTALLTALSANIFGGHSTLDIVDPSFNPNVQSVSYGSKIVHLLYALPDGKILGYGNFTSYNRTPTGKLVRLNPDGTLDPTFNTQAVTAVGSESPRENILIQPDGKIVILSGGIVAGGRSARRAARFNPDGTFDPSFDYNRSGDTVFDSTLDSLGRIVLAGSFPTPQGMRKVIRLNDDGTLDTTFNFIFTANSEIDFVDRQGSRLIVGASSSRIFRINENGSEDTTFSAFTTGQRLDVVIVQPDNKILYLSGSLKRLNEDGTSDTGFQAANPNGFNLYLGSDGKIVVMPQSNTSPFQRFLPTGAADPSFSAYLHPATSCLAIQPDNKILIGDRYLQNGHLTNPNNFVRLNLDGTVDAAFNPGGLGFQNILPGSIRAIESQPDGKIMLGGKFDVINDVSRIRLARLDADGAVDAGFQVNTSGTGNYFSILRDIYHIRTQADGRIVVSGVFDYVVNGAAKRNLVRLNKDGSIDSTFILGHPMQDYSEVNDAGRNPFAILGDGKLMVGISRVSLNERIGPVRLTDTGAIDNSFISMVNSQSALMYIDDLAIQPDGKIIISGSHNPDFSSIRSFVARLNADGSADPTLPYSEVPGRLKPLIELLPDGKILVSRNFNGIAPGTVERRNADGSADASFTTLSLPSGIVNDLLALPNGKIFVGGKFTLTVGGQPAKNLVQLGADGTFEPTVYNLNEEVLSLAADAEGRVLVGGGFTVIGAGGGGDANRSYVARLTDNGTPFDYDGDGRSDISVFRPAENKWYILLSSNLSVIQPAFGAAGDIPTPSDFDGDGKTDLAVFRPSAGDWWYQSSVSGNQVNVHFGQAGDIPRPSDFDGDGKTDFVVYRPSNSVWYRLGTTGQTSVTQFGIAEDKPLVGDFDGDGKSDPAVFRPSTGDWWYASSVNGQFAAVHWGQSGDIPVPGDYDADGKTDFVVYRPSNGGWYILRTGEQNYTILSFGLAEDKPVAGDYDGDGKMDVAVWRPSTGTWYLLQTTSGFGALQFGAAGDVPTENAFLP